MSVSIHPQAQELLAGKAAAGGPPLWEQTPEEGRAVVAANAAVIGAGPFVASVRDVAIPGQAGGIPARVYSPAADAPAVVVYYHGGGWVLGSVEEWDASVRALTVASGCDVVRSEERRVGKECRSRWSPRTTRRSGRVLLWPRCATS